MIVPHPEYVNILHIIAVVAEDIKSFPMNMIMAPTPPTVANLTGFDQIISNPSLLAMQKFFPRKAI
jgi:hypothetical protein